MNSPSLIEFKGLRFLIVDAPRDSTVDQFLVEFRKYEVRGLVRVCEPTYDPDPFIQSGITFQDIPFQDGEGPPDEVIDKWLDFVFDFDWERSPGPSIAIHCLAGLGRAPVLVAVALVERGMDVFDAVASIRKKRRGAINAKQLSWIETYKPRRKKTCVIS